MKTKDEDFVDNLFIASTHSYILIFTDRGRVYWLKVHEIPDVGPAGQGQGDRQPGPAPDRARRSRPFCAVRDFDGGRLRAAGHAQGDRQEDRAAGLLATRAPAGIIALGRRGRRRADRRRADRRARTRSCSAPGTGWRSASARRTCGPWAAPPTASRAIELDEDDRSWRCEVVIGAGTLLTVTENGYGKRTELDEYRVQSRGGKGLINIKTTGTQRPGGRGQVPAAPTRG